MKKSYNVNLGGRIFQIDEDAYKLLSDYLDNIQQYYKYQNGGEEIVEDIETRISEICEESIAPGCDRIINIVMIQKCISRIGRPENIEEDENNNKTEKTVNSDTNDQQSNTEDKKTEEPSSILDDMRDKLKNSKKLYRNQQKGVLGGVIAGLANYLNCDVRLLRIAIVLLGFIFTYWIIIAYVIMLIIIPEASTAADKLRILGIKPTVENIGEQVNSEHNEENRLLKERQKDKLNLVLKIVIIALICFITFPMIIGSTLFTFPFMIVGQGIWGYKFTSILLLFILTLAIIIYSILRKSFSLKPIPLFAKILLLIVWIILLITSIIG